MADTLIPVADKSRLLPGGFVGVDAFFVISGFLITGNLVGELEGSGGRLSLTRFYASRAKRIAPAVLVMLALNLFVALLLLPAALPVAKSTMASALSLSNVYQTYGLAHGYFGAIARMDPLTHLWSLGVEEQFYIVWPALLLLLYGTWPKRVPLAIVVLAGASFVLGLVSLFVWKQEQVAYFMLHTRAWQLLAGALVAVWRPRLPSYLAQLVVGSAGLVALLSCMVALDSTFAFPGWIAIVPTAGVVAMVVASGCDDSAFSADAELPHQQLLQLRPFVWLGLISYSVYLYHWPMVVYLNALHVDILCGIDSAAFTFVAIIMLGLLSYLLVEQPLRHLRGMTDWQMLVRCMLLPIVGIMILAASVPLASMAMHRASEGRNASLAVGGGGGAVAVGGAFGFSEGAFPSQEAIDWIHREEPVSPCTLIWGKCTVGAVHKPPSGVLLIGDSHAEVFSKMLHVFGTLEGYNVERAWFGACPPGEGICSQPWERGGSCGDCAQAQKNHMALAESPAYHTVIVAGHWQWYHYEKVAGGWPKQAVMDSIERMMRRIARTGKRVIFLGEVPTYEMALRECGMHLKTMTAAERVRCNPRIPWKRFPTFNPFIRKLTLQVPNAHYWEWNELLCPFGMCSRYDDAGYNKYIDEQHTNAYFLARRMVHLGGIPAMWRRDTLVPPPPKATTV